MASSVLRCDWCGRAIRAGTKPAIFHYANGTTVNMHRVCKTRMTGPGYSGRYATPDGDIR